MDALVTEDNFAENIGLNEELDVCPEFITEPKYHEDGGVVHRSELGLHLSGPDGERYTAFIRGITPREDLLGIPQKLVIRHVRSYDKILHLGPRIEKGNSFFVHVSGVARDNGFLYAKKLSYSCFIHRTREAADGLPRLEAQVGDHLGVIAYQVRGRHSHLRALPLVRISREQYEADRELIIRGE